MSSEPLHLVSLLAPEDDDFYADLAAWVSEKGVEVTFDRARSWSERSNLVASGARVLVSLCGGLYVRRRAAVGLTPIAVPVPLEGADPRVPSFFSKVVVSSESGLSAFEDLRSSRVAYNDAESLSGHDALLDRLGKERGGFFREAVVSGSHARSMEWVASGVVDAAAIDGLLLEAERTRRPDLTRRLRVIDRLGPFPVHPLAVTPSVRADTAERLVEILLSASSDPGAWRLLAEQRLGGWAFISPLAYDPVAALLARVRGSHLAESCPDDRGPLPFEALS